jgi:hypothetical protein
MINDIASTNVFILCFPNILLNGDIIMHATNKGIKLKGVGKKFRTPYYLD